jgi:cyclophilin family peptidyl-prolyl cis-trans isomerase
MLTDGMDVLDTLANSPVASTGRGENSTPTEKLIIQSIEIAGS